MLKKEYWNKENTVEFFAFVVKALIIIPGLLFDTKLWWLFVLAFISSVALIWSSTKKTIPTLIWFNIIWASLSLLVLVKFFM
jgi:hypothetical protein